MAKRNRPSKTFDGALDRAIALKNAERYQEAIEFLRPFGLDPTAPGALLWVLGHLYWTVGDLENAALSFKKATETCPRNERASKGLFHTLWDSGKSLEACREVRRFLSVADSADYDRFVKKWTKESFEYWLKAANDN